MTATPPGVNCTVRTSSIQSLASGRGVSLMLKYASLTWGRRSQKKLSSHPMATQYQIRRSHSPLEPWRLPVFVPTSACIRTWWKAMAKMAFTSKCGSTPSTLSTRTRCYAVLELMGSRQVCTVARVDIGQVTVSIRTKLRNKEHVIKALPRAKFKFSGCQKIHISKKWFTKLDADEFENVIEKLPIQGGCGVKYIPAHVPLDKWWAPCSWEPGTVLSLCMPTNISYFPIKAKQKQ